MTGYRFAFCGETLWADPTGALIWPQAQTVVISDLHLGKSQVMAKRGGHLLPPYDTVENLARLDALLARSGARRVISLGDSFDRADVRLGRDDRQALARLVEGRDWMWVLGNHDPVLPDDIPGARIADVAAGPFTFRHEALAGWTTPEVSGHFHPKASVRLKGRRITGKCFVHDARRLMLPAFGAYTGGLDIADPAISRLFARDCRILLCRPGGVRPLPKTAVEARAGARTAAEDG